MLQVTAVNVTKTGSTELAAFCLATHEKFKNLLHLEHNVLISVSLFTLLSVFFSVSF